MSYSIDPLNPMNNPKNILKDNVRMVLDKNYLSDVDFGVTENSWEILNVNNMNTFVFPTVDVTKKDSNDNTTTDIDNAKTESGHPCWCPTQVDIAIVFKTIGESNKTDGMTDTCPSFIKKKDYESKDLKKGIANRPCGFLTSRGSIMPMMIIPTKNYIQNGLNSYNNVVNNTYDKTYSVEYAEYNNCFNWVPNLFETETKIETINYFGEKEKTQEGFTFINASNSLSIKEKKVSTRIYVLDDARKGENNFYYTLPVDNKIKDVVNESLIFSPDNGGAFAFCYNFHEIKSNEININKDGSYSDSEKQIISLNFNNIDINIPKTGNIEVQIEKNKSYGSVTNSKNSQKMGQIEEKTFNNGTMIICYPVWNGIAISGGIDDTSTLKDSKGTVNVTIDNGFVAYKDKDVEMSDFCSPTIKKYNTSKPTPIVVKKQSSIAKKSVIINWGKCLTMKTINCLSSFAYSPVFFQKNLCFSLYIKDNSGINIGTLSSSVNGIVPKSRNHYLYPIYFSNNTEYIMPSFVKGTKIILNNSDSTDTSEKEIYYRFDFEIKHKGGLYPRRGIELFGFLHQVKVGNKKREMENSNGRINLSPSNNGYNLQFNKKYQNYKNILDQGWIKFATEINVNRSVEQSGGTITLDKYAMLGQFEKPQQPVGEVGLKATGGNNKVYKYGDGGLYFTGLGVGLSYQDTAQSDTMTLNLHGIEKKLQDIKLAGSPYFDGDPIKDVMDYLSEYANFHYEFNNNFNSYKYETDEEGNDLFFKEIKTPNVGPDWMKGGVAPCPRSVEFKRPAINFLLGTTVYEAIKMVCEKTNKTFFITKEGIVRIIDLNIYGIPSNIAYSMRINKPSLRLDSNQILNISLQPYFENVYNQVLTASLKGKRTGSNFPTLLNTDDMMPNILYDKIKNSNVYFPWSKLIVNNEMAILSTEEAEKVHAINCNQFTNATFSGGLTIPGNSDLEIFDTISIDNSKEIFYISAISHNYSSSTRVWTTNLSVSYVENNATFDPPLNTNKLTLFNNDPNPRHE